MKIKTTLSVLLALYISTAQSQENTPSTFEYFGPYKVFVNGSSMLKSKKKSQNDDLSLRNEDVVLYHIDADKNRKTFASNAVSVNLPTDATIEKAMVVWACNYNYCFIKEKEGRDEPVKMSSVKPNDGTIKFKTPLHNEYVTLKPDVIANNTVYDHSNKEDLYDPSVFSLDITDMLKDRGQVNGMYWLADFYTLQGQTLEGISSGWSIIIIYKEPNAEHQLVSGQIGYQEVSRDNGKQIDFPKATDTFTNRFEIPYSLTMFTLGGDPGEDNEQFSWSNEMQDIPIPISSRNASDVLNGTIDNFGERFPNQQNNFGVDLFTTTGSIPNIFFQSQETPGMTLTVNSDSSENLNVIYSILQMPVSEDYDPLNPEAMPMENELITSVKPAHKSQTTITNGKHNSALVDNSTSNNNSSSNNKNHDTLGDSNSISGSNKNTTSNNNTSRNNRSTSSRDAVASNSSKDPMEMFEIRTYKLEDVPSGYYVINGVFGVQNNRINWIEKLLSTSDHAVDYFFNPANNYDYVYCFYTEDLTEAKQQAYAIKQDANFEESWIMEVTN